MKYIKDFEGWNVKKKKINDSSIEVFFREREVWWCALGVNIGTEIDGKGLDFWRPVLVLRKYNKFGCLIIPLSSTRPISKTDISVGYVQNKSATVNLSQIRSISSKRFVEKISMIGRIRFIYIQKAAVEYNFPSQLFEILSPKSESSPKADVIANE